MSRLRRIAVLGAAVFVIAAGISPEATTEFAGSLCLLVGIYGLWARR